MNKLKSIERKIRNVYYDAQIYKKFGTKAPQSVVLPGTEHALFINANDYRARKMIITNCCVRGQVPRNQRFWRTAIAVLQPSVALDIGLNYGECLFTSSYPAELKLFAFEANQGLKPYIDESLASHPNRNQIECHFKLVTDKLEESEFWINKNWSGGSSAASPDPELDASGFQKTTVSSTTVDHVLQSHSDSLQTLFFKIDVEGYEFRVLLGMQDSLKQAEEAVGFIEFDPILLQRAGENSNEVWNTLKNEFRVFAFENAEHWRDCKNLSLDDLKLVCGKSFHTDLILVKSPNAEELMQKLGNHWNQPAQKAA